MSEQKYSQFKHADEITSDTMMMYADKLEAMIAKHKDKIPQDAIDRFYEHFPTLAYTFSGRINELAPVQNRFSDEEIKMFKDTLEKCGFTEQMFSYVSNGQMIPVELVNSLCRFLYQSHRHCFPGFMGFNRVTDHKHITKWLDDMKHPEEACVHACYVIRKYINGKKAADIMLGNLSKGFQHYGRAKDTNERIWSMIETMFRASIHEYYWTMEKKMHNPF